MKKLTLFGIVFFAALLGLAAYYFHDSRLGERKMLALLNGDQTVVITSFVTKYQQRQVQCTDGEVLRYIAQAIAKHPTEMTNMGNKFSYYGYFKFNGGGTFGGYMGIGTNGFDISVSSLAAEEGHMTHSVVLAQPSPEKARQLFAFLEEPYQKVAGTILILEEGKLPRKQRDESLVAK